VEKGRPEEAQAVKKGFQVHERPGEYAPFIDWLNARVIRIEVPWIRVEKSPGEFTEPGSDIDWHYQTCLSKTAVPLFILGYEVPEWHKMYPGHPKSPPKATSLSAFAEYCKFVAARTPHARGYEIWNEPNLPSVGWQGGPVDPKFYGRMLSAAYGGIKAVRDAPVISAGTASANHGENGAWGDYQFIKAFRANGNGKCDAIAFHAYESHPQYLDDRIQRIRSRAIGRKAITCTEFGWTTHHFSYQQQADYIHAGLINLANAGAQDGIVYTLRDPQTEDATLNGFGMIEEDAVWTAKPSAYKFRALPRVLS
jgi:hypothetical protein